MSSNVGRHIANAVRDNHISYAEAALITDRSDPLFGAPKSLGSFVDAAEHGLVSDLYHDVRAGRYQADPGVEQMLAAVAHRGRSSRAGKTAGRAVVGCGVMVLLGGACTDGALIGGASGLLDQ